MISFCKNAYTQVTIPMKCCTDECNNISTLSSPLQINSMLSSTSSKDKYYDYYNTNLSMWIPNNNDGTKTIKINFIVVQKSADDPQNFSLDGVRSDGTSDDFFLRNIVTSLNNIYANLADPSDNGGEAICGSCNIK